MFPVGNIKQVFYKGLMTKIKDFIAFDRVHAVILLFFIDKRINQTASVYYYS